MIHTQNSEIKYEKPTQGHNGFAPQRRTSSSSGPSEASTRTFGDFVTNPPFSDKDWSTGFSYGDDGTISDMHNRFEWGRHRRSKATVTEAEYSIQER